MLTLLGYQDDHETTEASKRDQQASERDQNGILARDQNRVWKSSRTEWAIQLNMV